MILVMIMMIFIVRMLSVMMSVIDHMMNWISDHHDHDLDLDEVHIFITENNMGYRKELFGMVT